MIALNVFNDSVIDVSSSLVILDSDHFKSWIGKSIYLATGGG